MARTREDFREYLFDHYLPRWREHGQDPDGAFVYHLKPDWSRAPNPERLLRVQARQTYVFAKAAALGASEQHAEAAQRGFDYLLDNFADSEHGGFFLTVTPEGEPLDTNKELYEHAFVLLACAAMHEATGDERARTTAHGICELLDGKLADAANGGFFEGADRAWTARRAGARRQNPHMHLFEAMLAWSEVDPDGPWSQRANDLLNLFYARFYDAPTDLLREFYTQDWSPAAGEQGQVVEPGHHFEWVFLLEEYARIFGEAQWGDATVGLWDWGHAHGLDPKGGAYDECRRDGSVVRATKRVWPQTEWLRALAIRYRDSLETNWSEQIEAHLDWMRERYCADTFPGWKEQVDAEGNVISDTMHATTVYHVFGAFTALMDAL